MDSGESSPLFQYLKKFQDDPTSRIFAPLAEAYRKAGLMDEAIEIAREGLLHHPHFVGGKVALARALFDKKFYSEVIQCLEPVLEDAPDNLVALHLVSDSYLMTHQLKRALESYKLLLFYCPQDAETAQMVWELEAQAYETGTLPLQSARETPKVFPGDGLQRHDRVSDWRRKILTLQGLLVKAERYKARSKTS